MGSRFAGALTLQHGEAPNARARQLVYNNFCGLMADMISNYISICIRRLPSSNNLL